MTSARHLIAVLVVVAFIWATAIALVGTVGAQESTPTSANEPEVELPRLPEGVGSIIGPLPGQGVEPTHSGDRGGAAQIALFLVIITAIGGGIFLVRRDIIRTRSRSAETS